MKKYDVIVIGAGHAGVEAAAAAARRDSDVLLLTKSPMDLGAMSCNPSIGGPGKSQMLAEMMAMGGVMPTAADMSGIQFRMLNITHGPATQALRAQIDRDLYRQSVTKIIEEYENIDLVFETVKTLDLEKKIINDKYIADSIVITTGTFLNGLATRGLEKIPSGRLCDDGTYQENTTGISDVLAKAGFTILRLKTGTPSRLIKESIDFSKCEIQPGDDPHEWFSEIDPRPANKQVCCFITHTTEKTHQIIRDNISMAPMYNGGIRGIGPRYCPSLEDKVMKFPEHLSHHVFLEPETTDGNIIYPNGLSTSFGAEIQEKWLRSIPALENVQIARFGYAIEYDAIDARALYPTLESKGIPGIFFAGQINGTSGYEEAAAQGLVAGANAAGGEKLVLDRTNSMIGVLISDITTNGVDEPYRMFTSRAEYRLQLRSDNAIVRLGKTAVRLGLIDREQFSKIFDAKKDLAETNDKMYAGYIKQQKCHIDRINSDKNIKIPADLDYSSISGLTNELKQKLAKVKPQNIADASRIQGMTPAGIMILMSVLKS